MKNPSILNKILAGAVLVLVLALITMGIISSKKTNEVAKEEGALTEPNNGGNSDVASNVNTEVNTPVSSPVSSPKSTPVAPINTPVKTTPKATVTPIHSPVVVSTPTPVVSQTYKYKDGTYSVTSSYWTPAGNQDIAVRVTLKNDVVTDTSITDKTDDNESSRYVSRFTNSYSQYVIGKSIAGLSISKVAGASLTTKGFNDALKTIRTEATI